MKLFFSGMVKKLVIVQRQLAHVRVIIFLAAESPHGGNDEKGEEENEGDGLQHTCHIHGGEVVVNHREAVLGFTLISEPRRWR